MLIFSIPSKKKVVCPRNVLINLPFKEGQKTSLDRSDGIGLKRTPSQRTSSFFGVVVIKILSFSKEQREW
jgi:hypothetical protein